MQVEFAMGPARAQAALSLPMFQEWSFPDGAPWTRFYRDGADYLLRFADLADFHVASDGRSVRVWPAPDTSEETTRFLFANQVLPLALSRQGTLVFHASAVEIDAGAVAFMGASGRGKSTLAASFATHGRRFLTDDGMAVEPANDGPRVVPSQPSLRLWDDSRDALLDAATPLAPALDYTSKSRFLAGAGLAHCDRALPLRRVYFLGAGDSDAIVFAPIAPGEALIELLRHSFLLDIEEKQLLAAHFEELSGLAARTIYYRLDYPRYFDRLPDLRQAIVQHATESGKSA